VLGFRVATPRNNLRKKQNTTAEKKTGHPHPKTGAKDVCVYLYEFVYMYYFM